MGNIGTHKHIGVFLNCKPSWGGQYQYTLSILNALESIRDEGFDITAIYIYDSWEIVLDEYSFERVYLSTRGSDAASIIYNLKCTAIICPSEGDMLQEIAPLVPYISVIHDLMYAYNRTKYNISDIDYDIRRRIYYKICALSDGILTDSETGKNQIVEQFGVSCSNHIYIQHFAVSPVLLNESKREVDDSFSRRIPQKFLFYPATLCQGKNHIRLLESIKYLKERGICVNLVLTGPKSDLYDAVLNKIDSNGLSEQVMYLDYVSDSELAYLYKNARGLIFPTLMGPTNIPPIEAMAFECPMAVSDIGEMRLQVGKAGILFDPENVNEISDAVLSLWNDDELCKKLKSECVTRYNSEYSPGVFAKNLKTNIHSIIESIERNSVRLSTLIDLVKGKKVICYGLGQAGWLMSEFLSSRGVSIDEYIDNYYSNKEYLGKPVHKHERLSQISDIDCSDYVVILCLPREVRESISVELKNRSYNSFLVDNEVLWELFKAVKRYPSFI